MYLSDFIAELGAGDEMKLPEPCMEAIFEGIRRTAMFRIKSDLIYEEYGNCPDSWPFWPYYLRDGYIIVSVSMWDADELRNKLEEMSNATK